MTDTHKNVSFSLGEHDRDFINSQVTDGRFGNKTEVVRAGLRLLEDYENKQKLERLRALIAEGDKDIEEGNILTYSSGEEFLKDIIKG